MSNIVPINQAKMPLAMRARIAAGQTTNSNFSGGIADAFPLLSIKGKVFRIRKDGQEQAFIDPVTRQVIPAIDVVLVNAAPVLSKTYYSKGFEDGDLQPPDCWSLDGVKPDASVQNKVNPTCANCPMNIFGSAQSQDGTKRGGKACADTKRIAVMMPGHLGKPEPLIFLLRVPATSLKNLKGYADLLARQGWEPAACVTRLQFDYQQAYPKLEFHFVDSLTDAEYDEVVTHAESPYVASMLQAPGFDGGLSAPATNPAVQPRVRQDTPVLDETQTVAASEPVAQPSRERPRQQAKAETKPAMEVVPPSDEYVELPDGTWANAAGEVFEHHPLANKTQVEMPQVDPNVLVMQDGRFYHKVSKQFVTGPNVGDPPVGTEPPKKTRAAPKKAVKEQPKAEAQPVQEVAAAQQEAKPATNGNGQVLPASAELEGLLGDLIPSRK